MSGFVPDESNIQIRDEPPAAKVWRHGMPRGLAQGGINMPALRRTKKARGSFGPATIACSGPELNFTRRVLHRSRMSLVGRLDSRMGIRRSAKPSWRASLDSRSKPCGPDRNCQRASFHRRDGLDTPLECQTVYRKPPDTALYRPCPRREYRLRRAAAPFNIRSIHTTICTMPSLQGGPGWIARCTRAYWFRITRNYLENADLRVKILALGPE